MLLPRRSITLPAAVIAALVVTLGGVVVGGAASARAVDTQKGLLEHSNEVAEVLAEAGRIEALVAQLGDARTNPAFSERIRSELGASTGRVNQTMHGWAALSEAASSGRPPSVEDAAFLQVLRGPGATLVTSTRAFAASAARAGDPATPLAPGQLTRGSLDGTYPTLRGSAVAVRAALAERSVRAEITWDRTVALAAGGTVTASVLLVALLLGPVRRRLARQEVDAARAHDAVTAALGQVSTAIEMLGVPVIVTDAASARTVANASARALFPGLVGEGTPPRRTAEALGLSLNEGAEPLCWAALPSSLALDSGEAITVELVRRGTAPTSQIDPGSDAGAAAFRQIVVTARPLRTAHGEVTGVVTSLEDVTERRARSAALRARAERSAALRHSTSALLRRDDVRQAACDIARTLTGSSVAAVVEVAGTEVGCTTATDPALLTVAVSEGARTALARTTLLGRAWTSDKASTPEAEALLALLSTPDRPVVAGGWFPLPLQRDDRWAVLGVGFDTPGGMPARCAGVDILLPDVAAALDREQVLRALATEASADPLTGAVTQQQWRQRLPRHVYLSRATGAPVCLLLLSVHGLDMIRAEAGAAAADDAMRRLVTGWRCALPLRSELGRYADGFGVVLPHTSIADALHLAEDLRTTVPTGVSCCVGAGQHHRAEPPDAFIARVDIALMTACKVGPGTLRSAAKP